jgi:CxxC motif-containing protein (DUF1111 family)
MQGMEQKWVRRLLISNGLVLVLVAAPLVYAVDAPAGFDNLTNGFTTQAQFDADKDTFDEVEDIADGLGPVYNTQSCRECHQNPVSGAGSQIEELRVARTDIFGNYSDRPGGSLLNSRAIDPAIQERAAGEDNVATLRRSLSILGDGFVEALPDSAFTNVRNSQPSSMKGTIINVPVLESPGTTRIGRFGWKNQQASLISFAADAYLNEMGITSPLQPTENTSNGDSVAAYDTVPDPEDAATPSAPFGPDIEAFARFMRSTKVPPRDAALINTSDVLAGASLFHSIGCDICHVSSLTTAPAGTVFNGGKFTVDAALGSKVIHPYSDFMLHDVGTGDGIIQNGGSTSRFKMRTTPLWGIRSRNRLIHDGLDITRNNAILFHTNEAEPIIENYIFLSTTNKNRLIAFLNSL